MKRKSSKEDNVAKEYSLIGIDGNAYAVMAYVAKAMRTEGKTEVEVNSYLKELSLVIMIICYKFLWKCARS